MYNKVVVKFIYILNKLLNIVHTPAFMVTDLLYVWSTGLPTTGHEGSEGEQTYSSTLPSTSALDGGGWSAPRPGRFSPEKDPVPIV